ncbi:MAG TPA: SPOR domain-containing protein, partial [Longimicrobiales bacterium]|nr:SPOR domain-containing protein [Longimicrobiales bacterium]
CDVVAAVMPPPQAAHADASAPAAAAPGEEETAGAEEDAFRRPVEDVSEAPFDEGAVLVEPAPAGGGIAPVGRVVPGSPVDDLSLPPILRQKKRKRWRISPILWVLLVAALAAAGWYIYTQYLVPPGTPGTRGTPGTPGTAAGTSGTAAGTSARPAAGQAVPAAETGKPVDTEVPVSVSIEVHENLDVAQRRVAALRTSEPDLEFFVSPVLHDGVTYDIVMAGPVATVDAGMALMRRLVQDGYKTAVEPWAVRPTALAFRIQGFDTRAAADARRDQLAAQGVPTYVVEVPYTVGPPHYWLYAGAYEYKTEASVMAQLLQSAGISAPLVPRTGRPVA